jgi:hypothetical protein
LWNVARTATEIRENMHLTLEGSEPGLIAYWQFNDASGDAVTDPVGGHDGLRHNMDAADWVASAAPVGGGNSVTHLVSAVGTYDFTGTGVSIDVVAKDFPIEDTVVVARIDLAPNTVPANPVIFEGQYWLIHKYGMEASTLTADLTFSPARAFTPEEEAAPSLIRLFTRDSLSEAAWVDSQGATSVGVAGNTATFTGFTDFGQYLLGGPWFTHVTSGLPGANPTDLAWGDYDNDEDLDVLIAIAGGYRIYSQDDGLFTDIGAAYQYATNSSLAWGDFDNDNDLDAVFASRVYQNDSGSFTDTDAGIRDLRFTSAAWGDYDNDGDLDLALTGEDDTCHSFLCRNEGPSATRGWNFFVTDVHFHGTMLGTFDWGDYDNDGDLDLLQTGRLWGIAYDLRAGVFRNDGPSSGSDWNFTHISYGLPGIFWGAVDWGDYDNDGDLDILVAGDLNVEGAEKVAEVYRNDGGSFTDMNRGLPATDHSSAVWGDFDNDGDLDICLAGASSSGEIARVYRNDGGSFVNIDAGLTGVDYSDAVWGDYDNDGDLDLLVVGEDTGGGSIARLYRNNCYAPNTPPVAPDGLTATVTPTTIDFAWNPAVDNETPTTGLSYNLLVGNAEHGVILNAPMADPGTGYRRIREVGNVGQNTSWSLAYVVPYLSFPHVIPPDYWGVQTIDHSFEGSEFATDVLNFDPITFLDVVNNEVMDDQSLLSWKVVYGDSVVSYHIQIDDDSTFANPEVFDTLFVTIHGSGYFSISLEVLPGVESLVAGTRYFWRVKPEYCFGKHTAFTEPAPSFHYQYVTDVDELGEGVMPERFALSQNYPNPFNPGTNIEYRVPVRSHVLIEVFNVLGERVCTLVDEVKPVGEHRVSWNGRNSGGATVSSGAYFYRIQAGEFVATKKMLLVK